MPLGVKQEQTANPLKASLVRDTLEVKDAELRVPPQVGQLPDGRR
jgi:hypothetical protein